MYISVRACAFLPISSCDKKSRSLPFTFLVQRPNIVANNLAYAAVKPNEIHSEVDKFYSVDLV